MIKKRTQIFCLLTVFLSALTVLRATPPEISPSPADTKPPTYVAYLATYFGDKDPYHLYYAISTEGFIFNQLVNGGQPILRATMDDRLLRDSMILRDQKGIYHLVASVAWHHHPFTMWDSTDLVHWTNERLIDVAPPNATKTWAPELAYDREGDQYFVYWTAEVNNDWNNASIYYATTKDFKSFSKPEVLYHSPYGAVLDGDIVYQDGVYHLIHRSWGGPWQVTSKNALGPYTDPTRITPDKIDRSFNAEGPFAFRLKDGSGWGLIADYFHEHQGFGLLTSPDLKTWERVTNPKAPLYNDKVWFPKGVRHGCVIPITEEEYQKIVYELGVTLAPCIIEKP